VAYEGRLFCSSAVFGSRPTIAGDPTWVQACSTRVQRAPRLVLGSREPGMRRIDCRMHAVAEASCQSAKTASPRPKRLLRQPGGFAGTGSPAARLS
jgi:hypothetical protein